MEAELKKGQDRHRKQTFRKRGKKIGNRGGGISVSD
jgi:hypothetical protein